MTIDPDHVMKRFVKHVSLVGFGKDVKADAWKRLSAEDLDCFGEWWYERDGENVPDAKIFFSTTVESELQKRGHKNEASFCCLTRNFFGAFNDSGIIDAERDKRINDFLLWFEPKVLPYWYRDPPSSHVPCPRFHCKKMSSKPTDEARANQDEEDAAGNGLPIQVLEAILIMACGMRHRLKFLAELGTNTDYDLNANAETRLPLANDRFDQSMDTESEISLYKGILGKQGRGQVAKASPRDAPRAPRKLFEVEKCAMVDPDRPAPRRQLAVQHYVYDRANGSDLAKLLLWNHPELHKANSGRRRKPRHAGDNLAEKRARIDPSAQAGPPIRSFHRKDVFALRATENTT